MTKNDMRSPLSKERDEWVKNNRSLIDKWARESKTHSRYIENRLTKAFVDGANAQEKIQTKENSG